MKLISILVTLIMILGIGGCKTEKSFDKLVSKLQSTNDSKRFGGIKELSSFKTTVEQKVKLAELAAGNFLSAEYEWQSIPGEIIDHISNEHNEKIMHAIISNFEKYDMYAKSASLRYLYLMSTTQSISYYTDFAIQYSDEIDYLRSVDKYLYLFPVKSMRNNFV